MTARPASSHRSLRGARRDRHGRGLRGSLAPLDVPVATTTAEQFDERVLRAFERLERMWTSPSSPVDLANLDLAVEDIPPPHLLTAHGPMPLGQVVAGSPPELVIFRRPIELRSATDAATGELIRAVMAELLGELCGRPPHEIDPTYDGGTDGGPTG